MKSIGHGTQHNHVVDKSTGAQGPPIHKNLNHLALVELTACVVCGDTVNLKKCSRCRIIPYCSADCQQCQWHSTRRCAKQQQPKLISSKTLQRFNSSTQFIGYGL